jgi:TonB-linked SusC/RagA family outer membrane protein
MYFQIKTKNASMRKFIYLLLIMSFPCCLLAQQKTISGKVTSADGGAGLGRVTVAVSGNKGSAVTTTAEGTYNISVPADAKSLVFSYVGMKTVTEPINGRSVIDIRMEIGDATNMSDVVVVGYTSQQKVTLTGSVATIKGADMVRTRNENAINMLTGKVPGVRVSQKSSRPGAYDATIDIRGMGAAATNPNSQPTPPLFVIDGVVRDKDYFARMSAEEIESVSILKDGTAAIYGMRAANGVVLVTTKAGKNNAGKVDVIFNSSYSTGSFLYVPEGVTAVDYYTLRNEQNWQDFNGNYLVRRTPLFTDAQIQPWKDGTKQSYNWFDQVFKKNTPQYESNLSVDGGNDKLRYYFNFGYTKQEGSYKSNDLVSERFSLRSNLDATITKRLKAKVQVAALLVNTQEPNGSGWTSYKIAWLERPDLPYFSNDNPAYLNGETNLFQTDNPLALTNKDFVGLNTTHDKRYNATMRLEYEIPGVKGLSAKALYDYTMNLPDYNNYKHAYNLYNYNSGANTFIGSIKNNPSTVEKGTSLNYDRTMQAGLYYVNTFQKHSINAFVAYEGTYQQRENFLASRQLLIESQYLFAGEANGNQVGNQTTLYDRAGKAMLGALTYDFSKKYLFSFNFRYDGSSRFPKGKQFGFFPSVSAGWRLSEETFLKDKFNWLSDLKVRASYGELGDDNAANNYPPTPGYSLDGNNVGWVFNDVINGGVTAQAIPNPNLTWYKAKSYNIALDFGLLKNKVTGTVEVFRRDRTGLLGTSTTIIPATVGAQLPQENINNDRIFGYELSASYRNRIKDISYYVTGQISSTKYQRLDWVETPATSSYDYWRNRTSGRYQNIWWGNESSGMFTSIDQIRNFKALPVGQGTLPGDWWQLDWNGDGIVDGNDNHPIATTGLPIFNYGISIGGSWRNFDIALDFQGAYGVNVQYGEVLVEALSFGGQNTLSYFMDRWRPADVNADYFSPKTQWVGGYYPVTGHDGRRSGSNGIMNASYVRLKTAEIGYTLPNKVLAKAGIKDVRVFLSGYNILTFTPLKNVDPERPGNAGGASTNGIDFYNDPITKTFTGGVRIRL